MKLYSIKDVKGAFYAPFVERNDSLAVRTVKSLVNSGGKDLIAQYPEDFELWYIAEFDDETGAIAQTEVKFVVRLVALKDEISG